VPPLLPCTHPLPGPPSSPSRLLLHNFCYDRVLTPFQLARLAAYSFPLFPDVYALVTLTAKMAADAAPRQPVFEGAPAAVCPTGETC
jgi:hypothetical protein